jgi:glycosyltransferase involved in cell wall biosynthesis
MGTTSAPRLLLVSDYYYPHWTGISKSVHRLVQAFAGQYDITVVAVKHDPALPTQERDGESTVIRAAPTFQLSRGFVSLALLTRVISLLPQTDIILVNSPSAHVLPVALLARLFRKRLLIFHQGDLILPSGAVNRLIEKVFDISSYLSFRLANRVATYTDDYARYSRVLRPFLHKFQPVVMPLPARHDPGTDGALTRSRIPAGTEVLFGFAGRFVEEKGFDVLFDAIPLVVKEIPGAHFVFAGETNMEYEDFFGRSRDRLEKVRDHVTMLGLLDEDGMADFYAALDFIVIPSRSDCFNLVQAEAMLRGKPSIVADIPGARAIVKLTGFGLTFEKEDAQSLARQLVAAARGREGFADKHSHVVNFLDDRTNAEHTAQFISG